jgi:hypothetical protein
MGLFWAFLENGTPATYFFKILFEIFSLVLFLFVRVLLVKKSLFVRRL